MNIDRIHHWHWDRVANDAGPIFWTLAWIWWIPSFQWLWKLRCRNVAWRLKRHNRRVLTNTPDLYNWSRT